MVYDPTQPLDSETVGNLPKAIRDKGINLKALLEVASNINLDDANLSFPASTVQAAIELLNQASNIGFDDTNFSATANTVQAAIMALSGSTVVDDNLDVINPSHGYYFRLGNGLQVCFYATGVLSLTTSTTEGALYKLSSNLTWTFPVVFIDNDFFAEVRTQRNDNYVWSAMGDGTTTKIDYNIISALSKTTDFILYHFAIGRWK